MSSTAPFLFTPNPLDRYNVGNAPWYHVPWGSLFWGVETMTTVEQGQKTREIDVPVYEPGETEAGWQRRWQEQGLYLARESSAKPKYYCLDFFPYPSGFSLSV